MGMEGPVCGYGGASVWVWRGPAYGYRGGQCMGMEGPNVWVWRGLVYGYGGVALFQCMGMEGPVYERVEWASL